MAEQHGYKGTRTYGTWMCMRTRCNNPNASDFHRYGGAGVTVCDAWNSSFLAFLQDMGERPENMTLDRVDGTKGYYKGNCQWATPSEQLRNTRVNRRLEYKGETKCLAEWAEVVGLRSGTLARRLNKGWSVAKALETPLGATRKGVAHNERKFTYRGEARSIKAWAKTTGLKYATVHKRISKYGMTIEEALTRPLQKTAGVTTQ